MTEPYTPTTDELRAAFILNDYSVFNVHNFDRWYAAEKAKWQAEAFFAGGVFVLRDQGLPNDVYVRDALDKHNPYRIKEGE